MIPVKGSKDYRFELVSPKRLDSELLDTPTFIAIFFWVALLSVKYFFERKNMSKSSQTKDIKICCHLRGFFFVALKKGSDWETFF